MKTPLEIKISRDGTITIMVDLSKQASVKAASATAQDRDADDLELRLMSTDESDDAKWTQLSIDILKFAEKKLKSGDRRGLLEFLNKNKHRFNADLKDWLKDAIKSAKG